MKGLVSCMKRFTKWEIALASAWIVLAGLVLIQMLSQGRYAFGIAVSFISTSIVFGGVYLGLLRQRRILDMLAVASTREAKLGVVNEVVGVKADKVMLQQSKHIQRLIKAASFGFSKGLERILQSHLWDGAAPVNRRVEAAWNLALRSSVAGEFDRVLDYLASIDGFLGGRYDLSQALERQIRILRSDALLQLGEVEPLGRLLAIWEYDNVLGSELYLIRANLLRRDVGYDAGMRRWLATLSRPLESAGFSPLHLDSGQGTFFSRVRSARPEWVDESDMLVEGPLVSVLMPAFNAASVIKTAINSLLAQTWRNLEIVVVDDYSDDDTYAGLLAIAEVEPRVRVFRNVRNGGAYVARNRALSEARGEYVMVHDSDDWSHPERISFQMSDLLRNKKRANFTYGVRVSEDLEVITKRTNGSMFVMNTSSFLMRREDVLELGGWDEVRVGGDSELVARFEAHFNEPRRGIGRSLPLTLILGRQDSLTQAGSTSIATVGFGARRMYKEFYSAWLSEGAKVRKPGPRGFPVAPTLLPDKTNQMQLDVLLVTDMSFPGGTTGSNIGMLYAAQRCGMRIGVFHWPLKAHAGNSLNAKILRVMASTGAEVVVPGISVNCKIVLVNHPGVLMDVPDILPEVDAKAGVIVMNQAPVSRNKCGRMVYDVDTVRLNFKSTFGMAPKFSPISPVIRAIAVDSCCPGELTEFDWMPMIDHEAWQSPPVADMRQGLILARHSRDHVDKWPATADEIRSAYCADSGVKVIILGGAEKALAIIGAFPDNWTVCQFDSIDVRDFLAGANVYVYYPHEDLIEAFGRAPMEAMAKGLPVLLPPRFEEVFGAAALYVAPDEVLPTLLKLQNDSEFYAQRVNAGFAFVRENCDYSVFPERVAKILAGGREALVH